MSVAELLVLIGGNLVGRVEQTRKGDLELTYERSWQDRSDAYPLSLSIPLSVQKHGDDVVRPFMEGLLPDNDTVLKNWARRFHVSPRNPFALLAHMGEDCAGAVQFIRPDRLADITQQTEDQVEWLSEDGVAKRLKDLVEFQGTGRLAGDTGRFSLAGAQPKMPLLFDGSRWGMPSGATPTTHILKPPDREDLEGFDINELFCLQLAREIGLMVAEATVQTFKDETALVVRRYDRERNGEGTLVRVHQEDACQALAVSPIRRYESEGGPGAADIVSLIIRESNRPDEDVGVFVDALALNWVIAGTDAHAKNYSFLLRPGSVRLAPLYDLISALPYSRRIDYREAKLTMRIDREYHLWKIRRRHWEGLAVRCDLDPEPVLDRVAEVVAAIPEATGRTARELRDKAIGHDIVDRLETTVSDHANACLRILSVRAGVGTSGRR